MKKRFAWSHSALERFENCPKQYYHLTVAKDVKDKGSEAMNYGTFVHERFDLYIRKRVALPMDIQHHGPRIDKILEATGGGIVLPEQKLCINESMEPTGWFDSDAWCRAVADLAIRVGETAVLVDWKTGKVKEGFDQVGLQALLLSRYFPDIKEFIVGFYWTKEKRLDKTVMTRRNLGEVMQTYIPRVTHMKEEIRKGNFPMRQSGLCRYCPVAKCPHNLNKAAA